MKKLEIIKEINNYEAKLVWEIDEPKFDKPRYEDMLEFGMNSTIWDRHILEKMKKEYLIKLLDKLKRRFKNERNRIQDHVIRQSGNNN